MELHDRTIRQDVRELGALLGDVIDSQESTEAFETVESIRQTAIANRRDGDETTEPLSRELDGIDRQRENVVARAFGTYFTLINLAEERERVRAIRRDRQDGTLHDSLEGAVSELASDPGEQVQEILDDVRVVPTFTAHPTEALRKTIKAKLRSISGHLEALDERRLTDDERAQLEADLEAEVTTLWQTPQVRDRQPTPEDEARNVQWYLYEMLFDVIGEVYQDLEADVAEALGEDVEVPTLMEFRSWAGSDRDGNPYVTPEVTDATLARQRELVLERYQQIVRRLSGVLSHDETRIDVDEDLQDALDASRDLLPSVAAAARERYPNEPYRQLLRLVRERLSRVGDVRPGGYDDADEFLADLDAIAASLRANGAEQVASRHVDPLRRQAQTFRFTLASLDLRDHQQNHTEAVTAAFEREGIDYESLSEDERVSLLTDAIAQDAPVVDLDDQDGISETAARVFERFSRLADWQREYGVAAIDTYAISMTDDASHVLEVLFLADQAGVVDLPGHCGLDVVPLLETESALSRAEEIMGTLFENEVYSQALACRGGLQEVMLGYSDSNKENGFLAANWQLYANQRRLADICDDYDVTLRLFHGRGGSISRGGGPMNEAMLALPNETVTGEIKFTEQGEAISEKYANPAIAKRNVEQMLNAQLRARRQALHQPEDDVADAWVEAMETMADAAREEYRSLLEADGFVEYFGQATPISVIEQLNLGSRPASRSGERTVEDLRAIPWVFSWTQSRCILPGWYALGTGLQAYLDAGGSRETLREMYDEWPFFQTTVDNAAISLAKTEFAIAEKYAEVADDDLREAFFPRLRAEYERTVDLVTDVVDRESLVDRAWLENSLERRNPYVDPLNHVQASLLARDNRTDVEEQTLRLTVKGIAAGLKNTG